MRSHSSLSCRPPAILGAWLYVADIDPGVTYLDIHPGKIVNRIIKTMDVWQAVAVRPALLRLLYGRGI